MKQLWNKEEITLMRKLVYRNVSAKDIFLNNYYPGRSKASIESCYNRVSLEMIKEEIAKQEEK